MESFWKNKNVIVTGGAGFIGSYVVDLLVAKGSKVNVVVSPTTDPNKVKKKLVNYTKVKIIKADVADYAELSSLMIPKAIILHFAAMDGSSQFKKERSAEIFQSNMRMISNMLEIAKKIESERFLYISSIEVYPKSAKRLSEDMRPLRDFDVNAGYIWSKIMGEYVSKLYYSKYSTPIAIARLGNVYGPRDHIDNEKARVIPTFIKSILNNQEIKIEGSGIQKRSFLFATDLADALLNLTQHYAVCDPVNIASSRNISVKELAILIGKICKKQTSISYLSDNTAPLYDRIVNVKKAKKVINYKELTSLKKGILKTIDYIKNEN